MKLNVLVGKYSDLKIEKNKSWHSNSSSLHLQTDQQSTALIKVKGEILLISL